MRSIVTANLGFTVTRWALGALVVVPAEPFDRKVRVAHALTRSPDDAFWTTARLSDIQQKKSEP